MLKLYPSWFIFLSLTVIGILLIVSSNNWFIAWIGFELSLIGFIPIFITDSLSIEGLVKYFLVQVGGSSLFILSYMVYRIKRISSILFICSIFIKLGVFPFFQWVPAVIIILEWRGCLLLVTVQKLAPLAIIILINPISISRSIISVVALRALVASILGFNQTLFRILLAYSSIIHTSWILISSLFSFKTTVIYLSVYYSLTIFIFIYLSIVNSSSVVGTINSSNSYAALSVALLILTGIPPFSIFFLKLIVLQLLAGYSSIAIVILLRSSISTYFYMIYIIPSVAKYWSLSLSIGDRIKLSTLIVIGSVVPILSLL